MATSAEDKAANLARKAAKLERKAEKKKAQAAKRQADSERKQTPQEKNRKRVKPEETPTAPSADLTNGVSQQKKRKTSKVATTESPLDSMPLAEAIQQPAVAEADGGLEQPKKKKKKVQKVLTADKADAASKDQVTVISS